MKFNEIMAAETAELTQEQQQFLNLHRAIMANGSAAAMYAVEMARELKEMRDSQRYKTAGFETFDEYVETACGIKQRQAYNYISVVEKLPLDFLQSNANLGISKLSILASMDSNDRAELMASHGNDLEKISTREIDKLRREYEKRVEQLKFDFEAKLIEKNTEIEKLRDEIDIAADFVNNTQEEDIKHAAALKEAEEEKAQLLKEIEVLKNAPINNDKALAELEKKKAEIAKLKAAKAEAEEAAKIAKERADKEIAETLEKERAAMNAMKKDLELEHARIIDEQKKARIAGDPLLSEYKVKLTLWQEIGNELLSLITEMEEGNADKCKAAFKSIAEDWTK